MRNADFDQAVNAMLDSADRDGVDMMREEAETLVLAYSTAYNKAFAKEYAEQIDNGVDHEAALEEAKEYAKEIAKEHESDVAKAMM